MTEHPTPTPEMPALGAEGDICSACQAPLAIDQRYCLQCGQRRGASRVDFAELLPASSEGATTTTTTTQAAGVAGPAMSQGAWTPFAMVASIAVLALMLLAGVMIGKDDSGEQQVVAAAPVAPTETAETAAGTDSGTQAASSSGGSDTGGTEKSSGGDSGGGGEDGIEENPPPAESADGAEVVDDAALDDLASKSPEDYAEASKNLPDTIALPGEPPPTDNEAPGGGSDAEVIE